ncbi:MAG: ABC transporter ATP-binding protein, partial [bacterium]
MVTRSIIEVKDLKVGFPVYGGLFLGKVAEVRAVDGVTFEIKERETLGLVGESGCGKTTIGRAVAHILKAVNPDTYIDGKIWFRIPEGETFPEGIPQSALDLSQPNLINIISLSRKQMRPLRKFIQMVFQDPYASLNPRLTVMKIVEEPLLYHTTLNYKERVERVGWLLEKVGLDPEQALRFPHEFSGGQRQRIGLARALATNPKVIVADEPVSALDVSIQAQVINLMQDLQEEFGLTFLFIAHDLSIVEHVSHRIAVMYLGHIVEIGPTEVVYRHTLHPYTKALLSAVPLADPKRARTRQ